MNESCLIEKILRSQERKQIGQHHRASDKQRGRLEPQTLLMVYDHLIYSFLVLHILTPASTSLLSYYGFPNGLPQIYFSFISFQKKKQASQ